MKNYLIVLLIISSCGLESKTSCKIDTFYDSVEVFSLYNYDIPLIDINCYQNKESFQIGDTLKLKYFINDSVFKEISKLHDIDYTKYFFYSIDSNYFTNFKSANIISVDTGYVEFVVSEEINNEKKWVIGITSFFNNENINLYDTTFMRALRYKIE